jgi:hypothetical protein
MNPKIYPVLEMAILEGVRFGTRRAYKHTDQPWPTDEQQEVIAQEVLNCLLEWFDLE